MAVRARQLRARAEEASPPVHDPVAIHRSVRQHRERRLARIEYRTELRRSRRRYWTLIAVLFALAVFLSVTIWEQLQSMFGI